MPPYLAPLLLGFAIDAASAFTAAYSRRWGEKRGRVVTFVLRNILGIPVWVAGILLAVHATSPALFGVSVVTTVVGWLLLLAGSAVQLLAIIEIRARAAAPSTADALVERGVYARIRHPIYSGLLLQFAGIVLVRPTRAALVACLIGVVWVYVQARCEEIDLLQRLPAYREYMTRVPRFLPRSRSVKERVAANARRTQEERR